MAPLDNLADIATSQAATARATEQQAVLLVSIEKQVACVCSQLTKLVAYLTTPQVVGIEIEPGVPTPKEIEMAKFHVSLVNKSQLPKKAAGAPKAGPVIDFQILDNQNDTATVYGVDSAGQQVDISSAATIAVTSSDTTILTVSVPTGVTFKMTATGKLSVPGTPVQIGVVATWNDGSIGPFSMTLPVDVVAGPVSGIVIVPGTPVAN
jgi:hypothetical protein